MKIGAFCRSNDASAIPLQTQYEDWLHRPIDYLLQFPPYNTWAHLTGSTPGLGLDWWCKQFKDYPNKAKLVISLAMFPPGGTLAAGAAGTYDAQWQKVGAKLLEYGFHNSMLRIGWEFNGNWYPWGCTNTQHFLDYRAYWIRIVNILRAAPNNTWTYCWCGVPGWTPLDPFTAFPGAPFADYIGLDIYDISTRYQTSGYATGTLPSWQMESIKRDAWKDNFTFGSYPAAWWLAKARTLNVEFCVPEWGLDNPIGDANLRGKGGLDNPYFIHTSLQWMRDNAVNWAAYFDVGDGDDYRNHALCFSRQFPRARQLYPVAVNEIYKTVPTTVNALSIY